MLLSLLGSALLLYAGFCVFVYAIQRSLIYFPVPASDSPGASSVFVPVDGIRLKLWVLRPQAERAVIYFGGNAEDVAANIEDFRRLFPGRAVYLVNYRGYGGSDGRPSEPALTRDALAIFDQLAAQHRDVAVIGRSIGAAVAAGLAARRPVEKLALVTPFDSLAAVAQHHFPLLPARWLIRDRYDSAALAPQIRAPVLVVLAGADEIIPRRRSEALIAALGQVQRVELPQAGHNTLDAFPAYHAALGRFIGEGAVRD